MIGLAGAALTAIGDVLILGRNCSGPDFDQAFGVLPSHIVVERRWQSLWNGALLSPRRIRLGTIAGLVGIGVLEWAGMHGITRTIDPGRLRGLAAVSAAAFAVSGVLTHLACGTVVLAYRQAALSEAAPIVGLRPSPRSATSLLAVSALASLASLTGFSVGLSAAARRGPSNAASFSPVCTPLPCVLATLLTFGVLPAPVGGYARPASISIGLMVFFTLVGASLERPRPPQPTVTG
jgi:hypothetical protein